MKKHMSPDGRIVNRHDVSVTYWSKKSAIYDAWKYGAKFKEEWRLIQMVDFRNSLIDLKDDNEFFICGQDENDGLMFLDKNMQWNHSQSDNDSPLDLIKNSNLVWKLSDVAKKSDFDLQIAQRYSITPIGHLSMNEYKQSINIITGFNALLRYKEEE